MTVLWYVHHHGAGHWRRALAVSRFLDEEVVYLSSAEPPRAVGRFVRLPLDAPGSGLGATANGRFHWAPARHEGLLARQASLLRVAEEVRPALAVVDVSVEVTVLLRAAGVPVVAVRLPGDRRDPAHQLGFDVADRVVMPVPEAWGLHAGLDRTTAVGLVSDLAPVPVIEGTPHVVVLVGRGGSRLDLAECVRLAGQCPDWRVTVLGVAGAAPGNVRLAGQVADPAGFLASATVVVANAGLGSVADVVRAGRPLVVVPEERPFGEQVATGEALREDAVVLSGLPGDWIAVLDRARSLGPPRLRADGAERFAGLVGTFARSAVTV